MGARQTRLFRHGFSMTEMLVIVAVIVALLGLLFPLLAAFRKSSQMTKSMAHLRQVAGWLTLYADDHRDFVIPSQFDYSADAYPGKVRSTMVEEPSPIGKLNAGTWADILWSEYRLGVFAETVPDWPVGFGQDYRHDSPGGLFYGQKIYPDDPNLDLSLDNPLRSAVANSRNTFSRYDLATPFGAGAGEKGLPGYFAANNFFNADENAEDVRDPGRDLPARWYTHGQIRIPARSMFLVDSFAGEVIQPWAERYQPEPNIGGGDSDSTPGDGGGTAAALVDPYIQVDFRYSDLCLMLFLDGHSETQAKWDGIEELEGFIETLPDGQIDLSYGEYDPANRGIRVRGLDRRISSIVNSPTSQPGP